MAPLLALSDERDLYRAHALAMWRDGYRAAAAQFHERYESGYTDAQLGLKRIQHGLVADVTQHLRTWDGWREDFGKPRPGDFPGREAGR
jgi:hypothetical protein